MNVHLHTQTKRPRKNQAPLRTEDTGSTRWNRAPMRNRNARSCVVNASLQACLSTNRILKWMEEAPECVSSSILRTWHMSLTAGRAFYPEEYLKPPFFNNATAYAHEFMQHVIEREHTGFQDLFYFQQEPFLRCAHCQNEYLKEERSIAP